MSGRGSAGRMSVRTALQEQTVRPLLSEPSFVAATLEF
ncbi:hypothetical protein BN903_38 [Halorubrum sp. AJ67]|nr:hypothetical protein BN903_38 [Halorubrum sp. AJ67]